MARFKPIPCALTIAGSDSGGGAGIQADLKVFAALGVHGTTVITCITAQNPRRVLGIESCSPAMVERQLEAILVELLPGAMKTGMLYSARIIRAVVGHLRESKVPLVVDPVMVSTSGAHLLEPVAMRVMQQELLPKAALITPNLHEAELLTGRKLKTPEDLRTAARLLHRRFGAAALVKGGHLPAAREAVDVLYDGREELLLSSPFIPRVRTHGTGCSYSAAITAGLARGLSLVRSVAMAKQYIAQAIAQSRKVAGNQVLDYFPTRLPNHGH